MYSGGKDSTTALHRAVRDGLDVVVLASVIPAYKYSMLYHQPLYQCLLAQSQSLGIPLESTGLVNPEAERETLKHLLKRIREKYRVEAVVSGALKSVFQYRIFGEIARELGLKFYTPLWMINEEEYLWSLLREGIEFIIISITSMGIPLDLLGKPITREDVEKLVRLSRKYGFNLSFEGGDAETLVVDAPLFKYRLELTGRKHIVSEYEGYYIVEEIKSIKKQR